MSDAAQGSGWWQASDGKWYSPDLHPGLVPEPGSTSFTREDNGAATQPGPPLPWPNLGSEPIFPTADTAPETIRVDMPPSFFRQRDLRKKRARSMSPVPSSFDFSSPDPLGGALPLAVPPTEWGQLSTPLIGHSPTAPGAGETAQAAAMRSYLDPMVAATYREPPPEPDVPAGIVGLVSAAVLVAGSFLTWADASGPVTGSVGGLSGSNGWGTLVAGLIVAVLAALVLTGRRSALVGAMMLAAALGAVILVGYSAGDILRTDDELAVQLIRAGFSREIANAASLRLAPGFAVVAVGAIGTLIGAMIAFARRV